MTWRPTRRAWWMAGGALAIGLGAAVLAVLGARDWRRAAARIEAYEAYFRSAIPGETGLGTIRDALARAPGDATLLALQAAALAGRGDDAERERAKAACAALKRAEGPSFAGLPGPGWGKLILGILARDEREIEAARKAFPGRASARAEPFAYLAALSIEKGEPPEKALEHAEAAEAARRPMAAGALLTLYLARAEAHRRLGDFAKEAEALARAAHLAPAFAETRERLARAIARRTADPRLEGKAAEAAAEEARLAIAPVEPLERGRKGPLYGLGFEQVAAIRGAIGIAEARAGSLEGAKRTLAAAARDLKTAGVLASLAAVHARLWRAESAASLKRGHAQGAADALRDAVAAPEGPPEKRYGWLLAAALFSREAGEHEAAIRFLDQAAKVARGAAPPPDGGEGGDPRLDCAYAICWDSWRRPKQAIEAYRRAIARSPGEPIAAAMERRLRALEAAEAGR